MITMQIEAILFASGKPVARSTIKRALGVSDEVLQEAVADIWSRFNTDASGVHLTEHEGKLQFVTNPAAGEVISALLREEVTGELTRPQLETLTIIAYRGPVTKPEIEQIRGMNCSLIIRNLLIRGLVEESENAEKLQPVYTVSGDFLRHLGLHAISELPEYASFHENEKITQIGPSNGV